MIDPQETMDDTHEILTSPAINFAGLLNACDDVCEYLQGNTVASAWLQCERADWLMAAASMLSVDRRAITKAACACARTVEHAIKSPDLEILQRALYTAEAWCINDVPLHNVYCAADKALPIRDAMCARALWKDDCVLFNAVSSICRAIESAYARTALDAVTHAILCGGQWPDELAYLVRKHVTLTHIAEAIRTRKVAP